MVTGWRNASRASNDGLSFRLNYMALALSPLSGIVLQQGRALLLYIHN
jgi:hypothetical protein